MVDDITPTRRKESQVKFYKFTPEQIIETSEPKSPNKNRKLQLN